MFPPPFSQFLRKKLRRKHQTYPTQSLNKDFLNKALSWADKHAHFSFLTNNNFKAPSGGFTKVLAVESVVDCDVSQAQGAFDNLHRFLNASKDWCFGFFSYDLKNDLENLSSRNPDPVGFPALHFFIPKHLIFFLENEIKIETPDNPDTILNEINGTQPDNRANSPEIAFTPATEKETYLSNLQHLLKHIEEGDIYEANYCIEFHADDVEISPVQTFLKLAGLSPMPFSALYKYKTNYLICASPERYLKKSGNQLISQPIKGTTKRGASPEEDKALADALYQNEKERAENMMIVDLVRNDLAKCSLTGSVTVEEIFGIYSFPGVHQMISTISSSLPNQTDPLTPIKATFPMGSMTGAPKIRAMELIEHYETVKRGIFSGAVGYFTPQKDFDFNVVIRSLMYNATNHYLSYQVGGAITYDSIPENEYRECLLKAEAIKACLRN